MSDRATLLAELSTLEVRRTELLAALLALNTPRQEPDHLLTVQEAAAILSVTPDWLYRHADKFRFTIRPGPGQLRFSNQGLQDYLKEQRR